MVRKVLIPLDGSKIAEGKIEEVLKMLKIQGQYLEITLLHVIEPFPLLPKNREAEYHILKKEALDYLNDVKKRIEGEEIKVEVIVKKGKPALEICDFGDHNDFDLVAMASHGHGRVAGWALGSVTDNVLKYCKKPILITKVS